MLAILFKSQCIKYILYNCNGKINRLIYIYNRNLIIKWALVNMNYISIFRERRQDKVWKYFFILNPFGCIYMKQKIVNSYINTCNSLSTVWTGNSSHLKTKWTRILWQSHICHNNIQSKSHMLIPCNTSKISYKSEIQKDYRNVLVQMCRRANWQQQIHNWMQIIHDFYNFFGWQWFQKSFCWADDVSGLMKTYGDRGWENIGSCLLSGNKPLPEPIMT